MTTATRVGYVGDTCVRVHEPDAPMRATTVVLCPPIGYEESCGRHGMIVLARALAGVGYRVVRMDYPGTGDSGGEADVTDWLAAINRVIELTANDGGVVLVGVRIGSLLATLTTQQRGVEGLVAWSPVMSGRRYVRELQALRATGRRAAAAPKEPFSVGGFVYGEALFEQLRGLDLLAVPLEAGRTLVLDTPERPCDPRLIEHWRTHTALSVTSIEGTGAWLNTSPEIAVDPSSAPLLAWLLEHFPKLHSSPPPTLGATLTAAPTSERPVTIATIGLDAIVHEPVAAPPHAVAVVLLNTGAEHHLGPGREWVALARRWAAAGRVVLRLDLGGLAESPSHSGQVEQETYGAHAAADLAAAAAWLRAHGHARMVVVGLCSGAYTAIEAGTIEGVVGVAAINPQLYRFGTPPGNEAGLGETSARVTRVALRRHRMAELDRRLHLRSALFAAADRLGVRHGSVGWLSALVAAGVDVRLIFGSVDPGLQFLERRGGPSLRKLERSGLCTIVRHGPLDHPMHEPGPRAEVVEQLMVFVRSLDAAGPEGQLQK